MPPCAHTSGTSLLSPKKGPLGGNIRVAPLSPLFPITTARSPSSAVGHTNALSVPAGKAAVPPRLAHLDPTAGAAPGRPGRLGQPRLGARAGAGAAPVPAVERALSVPAAAGRRAPRQPPDASAARQEHHQRSPQEELLSQTPGAGWLPALHPPCRGSPRFAAGVQSRGPAACPQRAGCAGQPLTIAQIAPNRGALRLPRGVPSHLGGGPPAPAATQPGRAVPHSKEPFAVAGGGRALPGQALQLPVPDGLGRLHRLRRFGNQEPGHPQLQPVSAGLEREPEAEGGGAAVGGPLHLLGQPQPRTPLGDGAAPAVPPVGWVTSLSVQVPRQGEAPGWGCTGWPRPYQGITGVSHLPPAHSPMAQSYFWHPNLSGQDCVLSTERRAAGRGTIPVPSAGGAQPGTPRLSFLGVAQHGWGTLPSPAWQPGCFQLKPDLGGGEVNILSSLPPNLPRFYGFFFSFLLLTPPEGTSPKFFPRVITKISGVIYCHAKGTVDMLLPSARAERASANPCHCPHPCSHGGTGQTWRAVQQGEMGACRRQQCRLQRAGRRSGCRCEGLGTGRCLHGSSLQGAELPGAQQQW